MKLYSSHKERVNFILFLMAVFVLRAAFDVLYLTYIPETWSALTNYNKDLNIEWSYIKYLESWGLLIAASFLFPYILKRPSDIFILMLGLGILLPMTSQFGMVGESRWIIYTIVTGFAVIAITRHGELPNLPVIQSGENIALYISVIMVVTVIIWMFVSGAVTYLNYDLRKVYEYRDNVGALIDRGLFSYLNNWVYKVFNLFLLSYALYKRLWVVALMIFGVQLFLFGVSTHKAVLFYPFLIFASWVYFRENKPLVIFPIGILLLVLSSVLLWQLSDYDLPASLFVRRLFHVPANNVYDYYYFFSENPHVYWSNSITKSLIDYPYLLSYPYLIGEYQAIVASLGASTGDGTYVNSSFISTGYMHGGFAGLMFYCLVTGFLFRLVDSLASDDIPLWLAISVTIVPMGTLSISADLTTALLTHGILISLLLLFFLRGITPKVSSTLSQEKKKNG